jgi:CubicO group peptidase (beta-lactamase class C family)
MTLNTVFDLASLSKVVSTTTAVMTLMESGRLHPEDLLVKYLPDFGKDGKEQITLRQLLTHYSGFPADLPRKDLKYTNRFKPSRKIITRKIFQIKLETQPGEKFIYSDIGFIALGKVVEKVTGKSLGKYAQERIFAPLGMKDTCYNPPAKWRSRIAPTEKHPWGEVLRGKVHDPTACLLGGVAGHAGLFSTAHDLARFCQMILNGGELDGERILRPETVQLMTSPQSPAGKKEVRGFGWDIQTSYSTPRGNSFSSKSFGHTGYTGTSLWIDPSSQTYLVILTNRVHPDDKGSSKELRTKIADIVGAYVTGKEAGNNVSGGEGK